MSELLPCPFCGGEAHITNFEVFGGVRYVICEDCGARMQKPTEQEAVTAWNTRATSGESEGK